ncbi:hypothetical protein FB566_0647 [Stackebrandtia endophytica]|uniref:Uncharacterized protein n=1 Tax=Stackebrandtia endophytica TaxID=1496996 RepID=A0A543ARE0_9ACTN|nr:hypothetical protein [Stackebrandtia endophytica]TQL75151.1 hypothetical protein FB566_0647 [Stackebrandtia endophytica]
MSDLEMTSVAVAVATSLAAEAGKVVVSAGSKAMSALVGFVKDRLGRSSDGQAVLAAAAEDPEGKAGLLSASMAMQAGLDPEWASELERRWRAAKGETAIGSISMKVEGDNNVVNQVGSAQTVNIGELNRGVAPPRD